jgi:phytoene dehydrogenase-like protein
MKADTTAYFLLKFCSLAALLKELSGYLVGGYITLIEALAKQIEAKGGTIHLGTPAQEVVVRDKQLQGIRPAAGLQEFVVVVVTTMRSSSRASSKRASH